MSAASTLQVRGIVPAVPVPEQVAGTPQALAVSRVPRVPAVPAEKCRGATKTVLLALADRMGVDREAVMRIPPADLPLWVDVPTDALPTYLYG